MFLETGSGIAACFIAKWCGHIFVNAYTEGKSDVIVISETCTTRDAIV